MNIYVVVEGLVERRVYREWIPLVNPNLKQVYDIEAVVLDNFYLISGGGYPQYFDVVEAAIEDVNNFAAFDRLVISVDSEEFTFDDKYQEIDAFVSARYCRVDTRIVIQHFCIETWGLGNRTIVRRNPQLPRLITYRALFDVLDRDPELLPEYPDEELNRSQFAERYLRAALNDRFRNLTYSKSNPQPLLHPAYFGQLESRLNESGHIQSFAGFLAAFV